MSPSRRIVLTRLAPFAGAALLAFALVPIGTEVNWTEYVGALLVTLTVIGLGVALPLQRMPPAAGVLLPLAFLCGVALLRQAAGGSSAGLGILPLLPLFWLALHGTRCQLLVLLSATVLYWSVPVLLIGEPEYPTWTLRTGALFVVTSGIIGLTVQGLVSAGIRREADLQDLARERASLALRLEELATTDPLTGAGNRRAWDAWLDEAIAIARRTSEPLSIGLIDLDHFKRFNDEFGHQRGDELLRAAVAAWSGELRPGDRLARYGGEEFVVLLPRCDEPEAIEAIDRLRKLVPDGQTCSAGVTCWDPADDAVSLLARADAALYAAKAAGRDRTARLATPVH